MNFDFIRDEKFLLLIVIAVFLVFTIPQLGSLFVEDELDAIIFGKNAIGNAHYTRYVYEGRASLDPPEEWIPRLTHLPMLSYSISFGYLIGLADSTIRLVPIFYMILTIFFIYLTVKKLVIKLDMDKRLPILTTFLFSISMYVVQASLLVQISTSTLMFTFSLFIYVFVNFCDKLNWKNSTLLAVLFALILWSKMGEPIGLGASLVVFYLLRKNYRNAIYCVYIVVAGFSIMLATWFLYWYFQGIDIYFFLRPFTHDMERATDAVFNLSLKRMLALFYTVKRFIFWFTPALSLLFVYAFMKRVIEFKNSRKINFFDFFYIFSFIMFVEFILVGGTSFTFPKHHATMMLAMPLIAAVIILKFKYDFQRKHILLYSTCFAIPIIYHILFFPVPLMLPYPLSMGALEAVNAFGMYMIPFLLVLSIMWFFMKKKCGMGKIFVLTCLLVFLSTSIYMNILHMNSDFSKMFNYGETGMEDAIGYVSDNTDPQDIIVAPREIGYYTKRTFYCTGYQHSKPDFDNVIDLPGIKYYVFRSIFRDQNPEIIELVENTGYELRKVYGNFYIYAQIES